MKNTLQKYSWIKTIYYFFSALKDQWKFNLLGYLRSLIWYTQDIFTFLSQPTNHEAQISFSTLYPYLSDKTTHTPLEPTYFYQDTWAAEKIFQSKPKRHYDVGSNVKSMGIIAQQIPVTLVDIRPIELPLNNLNFIEGTILSLPFKNNSLQSLSSLCVIEHIGLGRYGDIIDNRGSEKSAIELERVVKKNGDLYISVPIDDKNRVYFNAHRSFSPDYIKSLFPNMKLIEEKYIYKNNLVDTYDSKKGFGTGLYHFRKK